MCLPFVVSVIFNAREQTTVPLFSNSYPLRVLAFGEVACVRCAIANKFALYSLTRNIPLAQEEEF